MREDSRTLLFAAVVCVSCSLLLSAAAALLKDRQDANVAYDVSRNIVKALGVDIKGLRREQILDIAKNKVVEAVVDAETGRVIEGLRVDQIDPVELAEKRKLPIYKWVENGVVSKVAFPVSGKGLWSMLYGYLAVEADGERIAGISFYRHGETPGLGAEIEKEWFQEQFQGKKIFEQGQPTPFLVAKGGVDQLPAAKQPMAVDAISGATLTSQGVQALIRADAARYAPFFNAMQGR